MIGIDWASMGTVTIIQTNFSYCSCQSSFAIPPVLQRTDQAIMRAIPGTPYAKESLDIIREVGSRYSRGLFDRSEW